MAKVVRLNPLLEALRASPGRIQKILIQKDSERRALGEVLRLAKVHRIPVHFLPRPRLDRLDRSHQGIIAYLFPKAFDTLDEILSRSTLPFLVLLDEVEDPQNLGAVLRSAEAGGADGVVFPERRAAGLTETVAKVSAGALEHVPVCRVKNLARTMDDLKKRGVWMVGAEGGVESLWYEFDYTLPVGIVLGSEAKGLRPLVRSKCDKVLALPLRGKVGSLNVAAAAAIFIYEVVRQRLGTKRPE